MFTNTICVKADERVADVEPEIHAAQGKEEPTPSEHPQHQQRSEITTTTALNSGCPQLSVTQLIERKPAAHHEGFSNKHKHITNTKSEPAQLVSSSSGATSEADTAEDVPRERGSSPARIASFRDTQARGSPSHSRSASEAGDVPEFPHKSKLREGSDSRDAGEREGALGSAFQMLEESGKGGHSERYRRGSGDAHDASPNMMVLRPTMGHHLFPYLCPPGMYPTSTPSFPFPFNPLMLSSAGSALSHHHPSLSMSYLAGAPPDLSHLPLHGAGLGAGALLGGGLFPNSPLFPPGLHSIAAASRPSTGSSPPGGRGAGHQGRSATPPRAPPHALSACSPPGRPQSPHGQHGPARPGPLFSPHKSPSHRFRPFHVPSTPSSASSRSPPAFFSSSFSSNLTTPSTASFSSSSSSSSSSKHRPNVTSSDIPSPSGVLMPPSGPTLHGTSSSRNPSSILNCSKLGGGSVFRPGLAPRDAGSNQSADRTSRELQSMERMLTGLDRGGHVGRETDRRVSS